MPRRKLQEGKKPRRAKGEGTVYQRKDGRWATDVWDEINSRKKTLYAKTEPESWEKRAEFERRSGIIPVSDLTVADFLKEYQSVRDIDGRANTKRNIEMVIRVHVIPAIGHLLLSKVTQRHMQELLVNPWVKGKKLKESTVHAYYAVVGGAFSHAVETGLIEINPCRGVKLPQIKRVKRQTISPAQFQQVLGVIPADDWFRTFFILSLLTGVRKGELLALHWEDVDLLGGKLHITRNVAQLPGEFIEDDPKTLASERTIIIKPVAIELLKRHRILQVEQKLRAEPETWKDQGLVFCRSDGSFIRVQAPNQRLSSALKKIGIEESGITPHGCRHTLASQMLGMKINPKVVQEILGHSSIKTTLDIYGNCLPHEHGEAMEQLYEVLWKQDETG